MKKLNLYLALTSLIIDLVAIFGGLLIAYNIRTEGAGTLYQWPLSQYLRFVGLMLPVWLVLLASQGLYNPRTLPQGWNAFGRLLIGLLSGWGVMIIILYLWRSPQAQVFPRLVIAYGLFWTLLLTVLGRAMIDYFIRQLYRWGYGLTKSIVLAGSNADGLVKAINRDKRGGRSIIAVLENNYLESLRQLNTNATINEIIVADKTLREDQLLELLGWAEIRNINFILVPNLLTVRATNVETIALGGSPVLYFKRTPLEGWGRIFKRVLDIILVVPAIIILSPVYLILTILTAVSSPGPILYREARVGQDGRTFFVSKFRSMYVDWRKRFSNVQDWSADEATDPRVTKIGRLLRKTNLDELPQLWYVLTGQMSLVGPRPEQPKYVEKFAQEISNYLRRHNVKSGLTGWAQINGARGNTPVAERVKYDLYYIENWSIWFDLRIILATFIYVFRQLFNPQT